MPELFADVPIAKQDKIAELRHEIEMRCRVFPRLVAKGQMTQERADRRIAILRAIYADYQGDAA